MISLSDAIDDLAPLTPPPCFESRIQWFEYLKSAAKAQNHKGEPRVILNSKSTSPNFNYQYDYCDDCDAHYKRLMQSQARCNPNFIRVAQLKEKNK